MAEAEDLRQKLIQDAGARAERNEALAEQAEAQAMVLPDAVVEVSETSNPFAMVGIVTGILLVAGLIGWWLRR